MTTRGRFAVSPGWKLILHDAGLDAARVFRRANLPGDLLARERASLTATEYFRLWQAIDDEANDPTLPLRIGSAVPVEAFDPAIFAALCSPSLNSALERLARFKHLICTMNLHLEMNDEHTSVRLEWLDIAEPAPPALFLTELVFFVRLARIGTREEIRPLEVSAPVVPDASHDFTRYLGCAIQKGEHPRVVFAAADAARPFLTANEGMWKFFESDLARRLSELNQSATTEDRVHAALLELLPSGTATIEAVATKLGTGARTLQRRLKAEGLSFRAVLDQTREALARHYLRSSTISGAEISFLLGFDDPNSFFRAFNSWTGSTPETVRRQLVQSASD